MNKRALKTLEIYLAEAAGIDSSVDIDRWQRRARVFLETALGAEVASEFSLLDDSTDSWSGFSLQRGFLEGLLATEDAQEAAEKSAEVLGPKMLLAANSRKVFVVHGHDSGAKETVARFVANLGLVPIILHEQPSEGRTVIEKFEVSSNDVAFAVVLLTPDDVGAPAD